ncbi:MAG: hypothetical protein QNJ94_18820 [Alphaproteobacteria bacterium]|nr:hypothetical protein [Alphaproteobacteria bacterium]
MQLDNSVIEDPTSAAEIAGEAAAAACPETGASAEAVEAGLDDVRDIFRTVAERAIVEQDPSDPSPAAAVADAVLTACPQADEVVASELEALVQTAAGGGLAPPGPGADAPDVNSPVEQNREGFVKSPNTTRLGPTEEELVEAAASTPQLSPSSPNFD